MTHRRPPKRHAKSPGDLAQYMPSAGRKRHQLVLPRRCPASSYNLGIQSGVHLMKRPVLFALLVLTIPAAAGAQQTTPAKKFALDLVAKQRAELVALSDRVWELAETALSEEQSSQVLADYAEAKGFTVQRGVAGMPTAFVASYGQGRPVIAIMGEYDALPGISQKASTVKEAAREGAAGHGCGHNLFGAASLGAAVAIKEAMAAGAFTGTIRFLGTPAEESI